MEMIDELAIILSWKIAPSKMPKLKAGPEMGNSAISLFICRLEVWHGHYRREVVVKSFPQFVK